MSIAVPPGMDLTENKGPLFIGIFSAGLTVAIVLVALRLWVRIKLIGKIGADDYIMTASLVRFLSLCLMQYRNLEASDGYDMAQGA